MNSRFKRMSSAFLLALVAVLASCQTNQNSSSGETSSSGSSADVTTSSGDTSSSTTSSWEPGENAIEGATQPAFKDPTGSRSSIGEMRKSQGNNTLVSTGTANLLVVPVVFSDGYYSYTDAKLNALQNAYFDAEATSTTLPSVANYYAQSSYGRYNLSGVVAPTVKLDMTYYDGLQDAIIQGINYVISEILDYVYNYLFVETETYRIDDFDSDNNGKIDGIVLAYSWPLGLAFSSQLDSTSLAYYEYFFCSDTFFASELSTSSAQFDCTTWTSGYIYGITGVSNDSHEYIRQVGYMLGLESYTDSTGDSSGNYRAPLAGMDMTDGRILDLNPFSKYQLGWINPTVYTASDLTTSGTEITLQPSQSADSYILLATEDTGVFGEYLLIDLYTPTGLNAPDSNTTYVYSAYGVKGFTVPGIRVYKVDSRLIQHSGSAYTVLDEAPEDVSGSDGCVYDFAYTNDGTNDYESYGVLDNFALVEQLSSNGLNRHMTSSSVTLSDSDLFLEGSAFGSEDQAEGFYQDFRFDGNGYEGPLLGISFTVDSVSASGATLTLRSA